MNVSLTRELEQFVARKVTSGRYLSASEVVREALRLLEERDRMFAGRVRALRGEITRGLESGPAAPLDARALKIRVRKALQAEKRRKAA